MQTWDLYERKELVALVDSGLNGDFDAEEAVRILKVGLLCTQDSPKLRPSMTAVVKMLSGETEVYDKRITKPGLISDFMDLKVRPSYSSAQPSSSDNSTTDATLSTFNSTARTTTTSL